MQHGLLIDVPLARRCRPQYSAATDLESRPPTYHSHLLTYLLNLLTSYRPGGCAFDKHGACWTKPSVQKDEL
jgi:hypothetical protein